MKNLPKVYNCILELDQEWLTIWFNIPEKRNALSDELLNDLLLVFKSIKNNESIRGVIFRGKNGIFCSGADLKFLRVLARNENEAYEKSLIRGETSLILSPDSEFFKFFGNIKPKTE